MTSVAQTSPLQAGTLSALAYPNFRLYFFGQLISISGSWMQIVAQGWLVFHLTQSELWLGIVACAAGLPNILLSPMAGVLIDRLPRRRLLLFSNIAQMIPALVLAGLTFANAVEVWHIVAMAFLLGVANAVDAPSRQAIVLDLVGPDKLTSGIALNSLLFNLSRVVGPAFAGVVLATAGPAWCFLLNGLSFLPVFFLLLFMTVQSEINTEAFAPLQRLREGVTFARGHMGIAPFLLLAGVFSLFTSNIGTLLPAYSDVVLGSPKEGYAAISTAIGVGSTIAALMMATLGRRYGRGRVVMGAVVGAMIMGLLVSFVQRTDVAVLLMGCYGFCFILQLVTMNTLIQTQVPNQYRGRVLSLYTLTFFGLAPFGSLLIGWAAGQIGTPAMMGICAVAGGIISLLILSRAEQARRLL